MTILEVLSLSMSSTSDTIGEATAIAASFGFALSSSMNCISVSYSSSSDESVSMFSNVGEVVQLVMTTNEPDSYSYTLDSRFEKLTDFGVFDSEAKLVHNDSFWLSYW